MNYSAQRELDALAEGKSLMREQAARLLEATAADYEEMARRTRDGLPAHGVIGRAAKVIEAQGYEDKARLLRGQAGHVRLLK